MPDVSWHDDFIARLRSTGSVLRACRAVGVSRQTAYVQKKADPEFAARWDEVVTEQLDALEESALRRATRGTVTRRYDKYGNEVAAERRHETALTIFMLQKRLPDRYGDKVAATGPEVFAAKVRDFIAAARAQDTEDGEVGDG